MCLPLHANCVDGKGGWSNNRLSSTGGGVSTLCMSVGVRCIIKRIGNRFVSAIQDRRFTDTRQCYICVKTRQLKATCTKASRPESDDAISHWLFEMVWKVTMDNGFCIAVPLVTLSVMNLGSTTWKILMACVCNHMDKCKGLTRTDAWSWLSRP